MNVDEFKVQNSNKQRVLYQEDLSCKSLKLLSTTSATKGVLLLFLHCVSAAQKVPKSPQKFIIEVETK